MLLKSLSSGLFAADRLSEGMTEIGGNEAASAIQKSRKGDLMLGRQHKNPTLPLCYTFYRNWIFMESLLQREPPLSNT